MAELIITNGDVAGARMREAKIGGDILCWRDILHEGPVPMTATPEELAAIRVQYLADAGWGEPSEIHASFAERDHILHKLASYSEIILWFEHDLYDQLQLFQVLDYLAARPDLHARLTLIQAGTFLSQESPARLRMHMKLKQPVSAMQFHLARAAWAAFRRESPEVWAGLMRYDTSALPFLRVCISRQLEEFPHPVSGLTRTETFILSMVRDGVHTPAELFTQFEEHEEAPFMGDWVFWRILDTLAVGAAPFVTGLRVRWFSPHLSDEEREAYMNSELKLTGLGITALNGKKDAIEFRRLDRWMGGVHLTNKNCWRWDMHAQRLIPPGA